MPLLGNLDDDGDDKDDDVKLDVLNSFCNFLVIWVMMVTIRMMM